MKSIRKPSLLLSLAILSQFLYQNVSGFLLQPECISPSLSSNRLHKESFAIRFPRVGSPNYVSTLQAAERPAALSHSLTPLEAWCVSNMDIWYSKSLSIKCPFLKRRMADLLDAMDMVMRFLVIRHKSLDLLGPPPGCRSSKMSKIKHGELSMEEKLEALRRDWREETNKGYYITGRLNTTIYRDDCFFDGPDPDMPVRGLRKYLNAASQLFDHATSSAELLSLEITSETTIQARWRLQGVLHLPWHPRLPPWTGTTTYHFNDDDGLIYLHVETWDISVLRAFTQTLWPSAASVIWRSDN